MHKQCDVISAGAYTHLMNFIQFACNMPQKELSIFNKNLKNHPKVKEVIKNRMKNGEDTCSTYFYVVNDIKKKSEKEIAKEEKEELKRERNRQALILLQGFYKNERGETMTTKLTDLNEILFDQMKRLNNNALSNDDLSVEIQKSQAISGLADTIIQNGELALKTAMVVQKMGGQNCPIPPMLTAGNNDAEAENSEKE